MQREEMIGRLEDPHHVWDMIIVGGGATGLGVAIDAASRGYRTLLLEQHDFAKGTSSRSTKLVHGGVRYLQQGNISLVMEALKERGLLQKNAPHLVHNLPFIVPNYDWWEGPFYGVGMKVYDLLAGRQGFGRSKWLSVEETVEHIPGLETERLRGGVMYFDGQFDDSRLAVNMAQTAVEQGATVLNYMQVTELLKSGEGVVEGVVAVDREGEREYRLNGRVVVNATGPWTDSIRRMDEPEAHGIITPSQGVHIVLDASFLAGDSSIMVPHTSDGRVLFAIPWHGKVVVGTTDTPIDETPLEPAPLEEELEFLLSHAAKYMRKDPSRADVLSAFVGIRPLVAPEGAGKTSEVSRDHYLRISHTGLVTIAGGKWTTYRKMAEDTVDQAATLADLPDRPCVTRELHIHGYHQDPRQFGDLGIYGADAPAIADLMREEAKLSEQLHPRYPITAAEVVWSVREEMARTVEDFLVRRTRMLLLDARVSVEMAPRVAELMARELGKKSSWRKKQVVDYQALAARYILE